MWYQTPQALDFNLDESLLSQCKALEQMVVCTGSVRSSTMPSCHAVWSQLTANHHHTRGAEMLQSVLGKAKKVNQMLKYIYCGFVKLLSPLKGKTAIINDYVPVFFSVFSMYIHVTKL